MPQPPARGRPSLRQPEPDPEYWQLVHCLMDAGWYRIIDPDLEPGQQLWGFREGHDLSSLNGHERWIRAADEKAAMRILRRELRGRRNAAGQ